MNMLLTGPNGVGKTTLSQAIAQHMKNTGIIANSAPIEFVSAASLIDKFIGHSADNFIRKTEQTKNGILIIDEIDAYLNDQFGREILNAMNVYMGNKRNQPIIIATCYANKRTALMMSNEGLSGRFPHVFDIPAPTENDLAKLFIKKVVAAGLSLETLDIRQDIKELIHTTKIKKGADFANGREIEHMISAILEQKALRQKDVLDNLRKRVQAGEKIDPDDTAHLHVIKRSDIPRYDADKRAYVGQVISPKEEEPVRPATSTVVDLRSWGKPRQ